MSRGRTRIHLDIPETVHAQWVARAESIGMKPSHLIRLVLANIPRNWEAALGPYLGAPNTGNSYITISNNHGHGARNGAEMAPSPPQNRPTVSQNRSLSGTPYGCVPEHPEQYVLPPPASTSTSSPGVGISNKNPGSVGRSAGGGGPTLRVPASAGYSGPVAELVAAYPTPVSADGVEIRPNPALVEPLVLDLLRNGVDLDAVVAAARRWGASAAYSSPERRRFLPRLERWLRERRWLEEPPKAHKLRGDRRERESEAGDAFTTSLRAQARAEAKARRAEDERLAKQIERERARESPSDPRGGTDGREVA